MEFKLKPRMFEFFGKHAKISDSYKDGNDKGIWERYQEAISEEYDDELSDLIDNLVDNNLVPDAMLSKMIPTLERSIGEPVRLLEDNSPLTEDLRRKMLQFQNIIYNLKSTPLSYEILIRILGFDTVDITEFVVTSGFDSDVTLDDESRLFDGQGGCSTCREYAIATTGSLDLAANPEIIQGLSRIIHYLEPINARLRSFTYNGDEYDLYLIFVKIINGILYYDNTNDPGIQLSVEDGILYKNGLSQSLYLMPYNDGILYYNNV